jgi:ribonuclease J
LTPGSTRVVFLGGLGEIGRNMLAVESGGRILVVDCGLSFPNDEMLGVDLVLPDFSWVTERASDVDAVLLTHGHEDHVGALSWLLREIDVPVYGTPLTLGIARRRLDEFEVEADMRTIAAPGRAALGSFECRFISVSHSIPDSIGVAIETRDGRIVYTSDFKFDERPIDGRRTDVDMLKELGREGIDLLLSDSTNAERPGPTPSESIVGDALREIFTGASRRIVVACFASNLHRVQQVCEIADEHGRSVAFVGRSMVANVEVGRELGYLTIGDRTIVDVEDLDNVPRDKTVVLCTGSQGEPLSALSLIALDEHKHVDVEPGDTVILSASPIPGNEAAVHRIINGLYRIGADVFHSGTSAVHVSGHASSDGLAKMLDLTGPRNFTPVHGEYRQLAIHARIAERTGIAESSIFIVEDGDVLELNGGRVTRGKSIVSGMILVDGLGVGDVGPIVLRDRKHLAGDGILICVLTIDSQTGEILAGPDLISRGFVHMDEARDLLDDAADAVVDGLEELEQEALTDWGSIKKVCRRSLGEFVWQNTKRRPMILPVVMEV